MYRIYSIFLIVLILPLYINAQEIITNSGESMINTKVQVNWTIGELITETLKYDSCNATSGLNQPLLKIETFNVNIYSNINVSIFPNPTNQFVNIEFNGPLPKEVKIQTISGILLYKTDIKDKTIQLNFSIYNNDTFIVEIIDRIGKSNTYKIIKR